MIIEPEFQIELATKPLDKTSWTNGVLCSVCVEKLPNGKPDKDGMLPGLAIASDGYILAAVPVLLETDDVPGRVASDLFAKARRASKGRFAKPPVLLLRAESVKLPLVDGGLEFARLVVKTSMGFPNWRAIIDMRKPTEERFDRFAFNSEQLHRLGKALGSAELTVEITTVTQAFLVKPNTARVTNAEGPMGLIMPTKIQ